jgi:hypothetical protein
MELDYKFCKNQTKWLLLLHLQVLSLYKVGSQAGANPGPDPRWSKNHFVLQSMVNKNFIVRLKIFVVFLKLFSMLKTIVQENIATYLLKHFNWVIIL